MIKSTLIHLSMNMWEDCVPDKSVFHTGALRGRVYSPDMRIDEKVLHGVLTKFAASGGNMVIFDIGDAVRFDSRPEIALDGAWSKEKLREKLAFCRDIGLEVIPKLNFSASHDTWMKEYSRMLSTKPYYEFCRDVISEAMAIFDGPRFLHIGMDEEQYKHQLYYNYAIVRNGQLWWDDLNFYVNEVKKGGARAWMWSDILWHCPANDFKKNVPLDVLQSNWYYEDIFEIDDAPFELRNYLECYLTLDRLGYEQIATGSNWSFAQNYEETVKFCARHFAGNPRFKGFMTAPWYGCLPEFADRWSEALKQFAAAHKTTEEL